MKTSKRRSSSPVASPNKREKGEHSYGKIQVAPDAPLLTVPPGVPLPPGVPVPTDDPVPSGVPVPPGVPLDIVDPVPKNTKSDSKKSEPIDLNDNDALRKRIAELEKELKEAKEEIEIFHKLFNQDQIDRARGVMVNWSDKTLAGAIQTKFLLRETGYQHLQEIFPKMWPHTRTLNKHLADYRCGPGPQEDAFELLKMKAPNFSEKGRYCVLKFDEIHIKDIVEYDPTNRCLSGFITMPMHSDKTIYEGKVHIF